MLLTIRLMTQAADISILPANAADVPVILAFIRGLAEYEKLTHQCVATEESLRKSLFGDRPFAEVLIARAGDKPVGFALFFYNYSTFLAQPGIHLEDLFVLPDFRHRGIGKSLLTALAKIALERHCGRLEWTVLDWNQPAIDFYKKIGAAILPDWKICRMTRVEISKLADLR